MLLVETDPGGCDAGDLSCIRQAGRQRLDRFVGAMQTPPSAAFSSAAFDKAATRRTL
jgi:hypothetical protein